MNRSGLGLLASRTAALSKGQLLQQQQLPHQVRWRSSRAPLPVWSFKSSPYDTLEVPKTATAAEIKKQYYKLSFQHHPDRHATATPEEKSKAQTLYIQIQAAYDLLSDPLARRDFDRGEGGTDGSRHWTAQATPDEMSRWESQYGYTHGFHKHDHGETASDLKVLAPWFYGLCVFLVASYTFFKYMGRRRERERNRAWQDWVEAKAIEGMDPNCYGRETHDMMKLQREGFVVPGHTTPKSARVREKVENQ
ncbi:hypothetical protein HDU76_010212 [Blyttiomyces sp. JEL0837]|nr:hypothetical protein HDU76_010212 [Blyttiomyces sp. JEL0837]